MKIGIDGTPLTILSPRGTKHYAEQLITHLAKIDKKNEYIVFASKIVPIPNQKNFKFVRISSFLPVLKRQLFLAFYARREKIEVFHYLEPFGAIFFKNNRIVTTIHDLNLNKTYPWLSKYFLTRLYCEAIRLGVINNSKVFITDTYAIAEELKDFLYSSNKRVKIYTIPLSYDIRFTPEKKSNLKQKHFLCMGDFTIRKNISGVLKAYSLLPQRIRRQFKLKVIVNNALVKYKFISYIKSLNLDSYVEILEAVSLSRLIALYRGALAFLYPSFYEGFGIPILEAMACGCPVITSSHGAMKEVAGEAAYLVDPKSVRAIATAMQRIAKDKKLAKELKDKGLKRAKAFSWRETAKKTLKVYEQVYNT